MFLPAQVKTRSNLLNLVGIGLKLGWVYYLLAVSQDIYLDAFVLFVTSQILHLAQLEAERWRSMIAKKFLCDQLLT